MDKENAVAEAPATKLRRSIPPLYNLRALCQLRNMKHSVVLILCSLMLISCETTDPAAAADNRKTMVQGTAMYAAGGAALGALLAGDGNRGTGAAVGGALGGAVGAFSASNKIKKKEVYRAQENQLKADTAVARNQNATLNRQLNQIESEIRSLEQAIANKSIEQSALQSKISELRSDLRVLTIDRAVNPDVYERKRSLEMRLEKL